jgi:hypothetical protein
MQKQPAKVVSVDSELSDYVNINPYLCLPKHPAQALHYQVEPVSQPHDLFGPDPCYDHNLG